MYNMTGNITSQIQKLNNNSNIFTLYIKVLFDNSVKTNLIYFYMHTQNVEKIHTRKVLHVWDGCMQRAATPYATAMIASDWASSTYQTHKTAKGINIDRLTRLKIHKPYKRIQGKHKRTI